MTHGGIGGLEIEPLLWIATGLGLGLAPMLPGTAGALLGTPISYFASRLSAWKQAAIAFILVLIAVPICHRAERVFEGEDDSRIVADEYLTFPLATLGLPCAKHPSLLACVFVASRVLDHAKPPPAAQAEQAPGGVGIVLDDVISNLYSLGVGWAIYGLAARRRARRRRRPSDEKSS
jgi:phosphatidylglycerophosphatase A